MFSNLQSKRKCAKRTHHLPKPGYGVAPVHRAESPPADSIPTKGPMKSGSPDQILQVGFGFWASRTLLSAVEMGLFTELAKQPGELSDVAQRLRLHPRSAQDFLDALVALEFLERDGGVYRNTPGSDAFLDKNKPSYIGGMMEMCSARLYGFWNNLTEALRTG